MKKTNNQSNNNQNTNRNDGHGHFQRGSNIPPQTSPPPMPNVKPPKSDNSK